jgi:hypothetical protein
VYEKALPPSCACLLLILKLPCPARRLELAHALPNVLDAIAVLVEPRARRERMNHNCTPTLRLLPIRVQSSPRLHPTGSRHGARTAVSWSGRRIMVVLLHALSALREYAVDTLLGFYSHRTCHAITGFSSITLAASSHRAAHRSASTSSPRRSWRDRGEERAREHRV